MASLNRFSAPNVLRPKLRSAFQARALIPILRFSDGHPCIHYLPVSRILGLDAVLTSHGDTEIRMVDELHHFPATGAFAEDGHIVRRMRSIPLSRFDLPISPLPLHVPEEWVCQ